ncbi:MAG: hypothetical protein U1E22_06220 [Coriobacteriia bacterium]|nr:hypothetical protein [Coriobacteriia bacterium]
MVREFLLNQLWSALLVVSVLYLIDYRLSIIGRRLFRQGADRHYDLGGSYELNTPFIADIEAGRLISHRHLVALLRIWATLAVAWWFTVHAGRLIPLYTGVVGFFLLTQMPVFMRHTQNIVLFSFVARRGGIEGRARAARWLDLKLSGVLFWYFTAVFLLLWGLLGDALFAGGALGTLLAGARFWIFGGEAEEGEAGSAMDASASGSEPLVP